MSSEYEMSDPIDLESVDFVEALRESRERLDRIDQASMREDADVVMVCGLAFPRYMAQIAIGHGLPVTEIDGSEVRQRWGPSPLRGMLADFGKASGDGIIGDSGVIVVDEVE